ncbi:MAG TPA: hypothetical protein VF090_09055 [Methyloceanibacter sp.]|jgi:hypothetical protein
MIEDGRDLAFVLTLKFLLRRLEHKGVISYPEIQRMLDEALGEVKRLRMEMAVTPEAAEEATILIGGLYSRD